MGKSATLKCLKISFLIIVCSFVDRNGFGQIVHLSPAELKAQTRKSQKEAARYQAEHMETDLSVHNLNLRKGETSRRQVRELEQPADYVFDNEINAIYQQPREQGRKARARKNKKDNK